MFHSLFPTDLEGNPHKYRGEKVQGTSKVFLGTIGDTTRKQINFSSMKKIIFIIKEYNKRSY